jgi:hypothetical protein
MKSPVFPALLAALLWLPSSVFGQEITTLEEGTGEIEVSVNIERASVIVDGKLVGYANSDRPYRFIVQAGVREILITREGYNRSIQQLLVMDSFTKKVHVELVRELPGLVILCNISDCQVSIDGLAVGTTPLQFETFDMGSHTLLVERDGFVPYERVISIETPDVYTIEVELESAYGTLELRSIPEGATVYLDGRNMGVTPLTLANAPAGGHTLRLTKEGYGEQFTKIRILPDRVTPIQQTLGTDGTQLMVKVRTPNALVYLNGTSIGSGVVEIGSLAPGIYDLRVSAQGFRDHYEQLEVKGEKTRRVVVSPLQELGTAMQVEQKKESGSLNKKALIGALVGLGASAGLATGGYFLFRPKPPTVEIPQGIDQVLTLPMVVGPPGVSIRFR